MSIRTAWELLNGPSSPVRVAPLVRPQVEAWTTSRLDPVEVVWGDLFGTAPIAPTRAEAMTVPAIARARKLLVTSVAGMPLRAYRADVLVTPQPSWMYRTDGLQPPWLRMAWTVDDLMFYGWSLWLVNTFGADNYPIAIDRVPYGTWDVDVNGQLVDEDNRPFPAERVILIAGPDEGILSFGGRTIRTAAMLETTTASVATHPFRLELHQTSGDQLTDVEISELIGTARTALADNEGIIYTNQAIEANALGAGGAEQLLVEGRNASAVDCARLVGIPAAMIDATTAGASLTYETTTGRNQQFLDYAVAAYTGPIAARLGMDDVLPGGQRAAFDSSTFTTPTPSASGPITED